MFTESQRLRRGLPLTPRLALALTVASFFVALLVAFLGADRQARNHLDAEATGQAGFAHQFADRIAPLLERGDLLRLSTWAMAGRDLAGGRLLVLDRSGRVVIDTACVEADRQKNLLTQGGSLQRLVEQNADQFRESLAAVRFGGETIGEVRLQVPLALAAADFDLGLFALVLLCCLSLVAVGALMVHHWSTRVRCVTDTLVQLASGQVAPARSEAAPGELQELGQALQELEKGMLDGLNRVVDGFVGLGLQIVDGLERRHLVPKGHGERTARYAGLLAERLQLLPSDRRDLEVACRLHDLGKAWLRPGLLQKRGNLSEDELASIQNHPLHAAEHLELLPGLRRAAAMVRHQHENYGGSGGPDGLRGERIPLGSRVLAIASAFDLLTTCGDDRALDWGSALQQMAEDRGERYDPWLLELFAEEIRRAPPDVDVDRPVMILPVGMVHEREAERFEQVEDDVDRQELEVMLDDSLPEERS